MTLQGIRAGDIVEVDKRGRRFLAYVRGRESREVLIRPVDRRISYSTATAREIVDHWRRRRTT